MKAIKYFNVSGMLIIIIKNILIVGRSSSSKSTETRPSFKKIFKIVR